MNLKTPDLHVVPQVDHYMLLKFGVNPPIALEVTGQNVNLWA